MHVANLIRPNMSRFRRISTGPRCTMQSLERRTLMSGDWATVSDGIRYSVASMTADNSGNVYALDESPASVLKSSDAGATWNVIAQAPASTVFESIAIDADGDLLVAARTYAADGLPHWQVLEQAAGQSGFKVIDDVSRGDCSELTTDDARNVYAIGTTTVTTATRGKTTSTTYATVRKLTAGQSNFVTVDRVAGMSSNGIAVIEGGSASAGVYVTGSQNGEWIVRKSVNGGGNWSEVDRYRYPSVSSSSTSSNWGTAVVGDLAGNVFVAGNANVRTLTGYTKNKTPIYRSEDKWLVRKSAGGQKDSWTTNDNYEPSESGRWVGAMGTDLAGNVYVVGQTWAGEGGSSYGVVRTNSTNSSGTPWTTVDRYGPEDERDVGYEAFTTDSNGNLYAGGNYWSDNDNGWLIRSAVGPAAPPVATFSSASITDGSLIEGARLVEELFGA
jgi:hypothetical protein